MEISYKAADGSTVGITQAAPLPVALASPITPWNYAAASGGITGSTTGVTAKAAAGAGLRNYITSISVSAPTLSALTGVEIRDGASGTVLWRGILGTAGGSINITLPVPLRGTANTLLEIACSASVTGGVHFNLAGYVAP